MLVFVCLLTTFDGKGWMRSGEFCEIKERFCVDEFPGPKLLFMLPSTASGSTACSSFLICNPSLLVELLPLPDAFVSSLLSTVSKKC
jgi:hypothetical protein